MKSKMFCISGPFDIRNPEEKRELGRQVSDLSKGGIKFELRPRPGRNKCHVELWRESKGRADFRTALKRNYATTADIAHAMIKGTERRVFA